MSEKILLSRIEAAEYIGVSVSTLDMILARRLLRGRRIGRRVLIHKADLDRFVRADHTDPIWPKQVGGKTTRVIPSAEVCEP